MFAVDKFGTWLVTELESRDISQSELARQAGISRGTLSNIISGARGRGPDTLLAIARALKIPPEQVYREAGILPARPDINETQEKIIYELQNLNDQDQQEILAFIRMKNNLRKKK